MEDRELKYLEACNLIDIRKFDEAEKIFTDLLKEDSHNHLYFNKMGVIRASQHKLEEAKGYFKACIDVKPDYAPAIVNLGNLYLEEADYETALGYYEQALLKDPNYHLAYYNIAVAYKKMGNLDKYFKNIKLYKQSYKEFIKAKNKEEVLKHQNKALQISGILIVIVVLFFILK